MACVKINPSENNAGVFFLLRSNYLENLWSLHCEITNPSKIMICSDPPEATEAAQFNNKILSAIPSFVKLGNKNHSFALVAFFF